jgi:sortase (surface protein transpeptidase)
MRWRHQCLVWCQYIFLVLCLLALGYCVKSLTQARLYQRWARQQIERQPSYKAASTAGPKVEQQKETFSSGLAGMSPIGRLEIPRAHISAVVAEGTSHRDTFFRHLSDVRSGDIIEMKEPGHEYRYQVRFTAVVGPKDTWVLEPTRKETLTLLTCYPFHFVGPAPTGS